MDEEKNNEKKDENIEGSLMEKCETYKNGINDKNHIYMIRTNYHVVIKMISPLMNIQT